MTIHPSANIHPSACIENGAVIEKDVSIGPFCMIGAKVILRAGVCLKSHVVVEGLTDIGSNTTIFPFASIGHQPQDLKYAGESTKLQIGKHNRIREYVTINPGTAGGGGITSVGDGGLYMMGVHIGHDCRVGNNVILANNASLGGHCIIEDNVIIGALAGIHQFCHIGRGAMIGGLSAVVGDVIPMGVVMGERANLSGLNIVGLKRAGMDKGEINALRQAFKDIFKSKNTIEDSIEIIRGRYENNPSVMEIIEFISKDSKRSLSTPK